MEQLLQFIVTSNKNSDFSLGHSRKVVVVVHFALSIHDFLDLHKKQS